MVYEVNMADNKLKIKDHCHKHEAEMNRLKRIEGQIRGVTKMIENDRYCIDILTQLKSIKNALRKVEENILKRHIQTCIVDAVKSESEDLKDKKINEVMQIISKF
jgi:CsoR family transcriptional regulator, copper-sensing transcriptional repressor